MVTFSVTLTDPNPIFKVTDTYRSATYDEPVSYRLRDRDLSRKSQNYNLAPYCPIKTKFGMRRHNRTHTTAR